MSHAFVQRLALCTCLLPMVALGQGRSDYAQQWPVNLSRDGGGAYRLTLDESVYRQLRDAQLRDLTVVNAEGAPVPTEVLGPQAPLARPARSVVVPFYALPAAPAERGGWELVSQADAEGRLSQVEVRITDRAAATLPRSALLVDISRVREPIVALHLQWQPAGAVDAGYRVDVSDDLEHWQPLAVRGRLVDLQGQGQRLLKRRIEVSGLSVHVRGPRYLRLTPERGDRAPVITAVSTELAAPTAAPAPSWVELSGRRVRTEQGDAFEFLSDGRFPVEQADVVLAGNHAGEWRLESRDDQDEPWRLRAGPWVAFRVGEDQRGGNRSPAQSLHSMVRDRYWRLRSNTPVSELPRLRLGYRPEVVVFLAQGQPPFALLAGSTRARREQSPMRQLVAELRRQRGEDWQPAPAYLGTARELAGASAISPVYDWKRWLLWGVLVVGAVVILVFAVSLLRTSKPGEGANAAAGDPPAD